MPTTVCVMSKSHTRLLSRNIGLDSSLFRSFGSYMIFQPIHLEFIVPLSSTELFQILYVQI